MCTNLLGAGAWEGLSSVALGGTRLHAGDRPAGGGPQGRLRVTKPHNSRTRGRVHLQEIRRVLERRMCAIAAAGTRQHQPQADGPLSADRLDLLAHNTRGMIDDQEMWPVVADLIYGKAAAVEQMLDSGRLRPDARVFMDYPLNNFQSLLDIAIEAGQRDVIKVLLGTAQKQLRSFRDQSLLQGPIEYAARHRASTVRSRVAGQPFSVTEKLTDVPEVSLATAFLVPQLHGASDALQAEEDLRH